MKKLSLIDDIDKKIEKLNISALLSWALISIVFFIIFFSYNVEFVDVPLALIVVIIMGLSISFGTGTTIVLTFITAEIVIWYYDQKKNYLKKLREFINSNSITKNEYDLNIHKRKITDLKTDVEDIKNDIRGLDSIIDKKWDVERGNVSDLKKLEKDMVDVMAYIKVDIDYQSQITDLKGEIESLLRKVRCIEVENANEERYKLILKRIRDLEEVNSTPEGTDLKDLPKHKRPYRIASGFREEVTKYKDDMGSTFGYYGEIPNKKDEGDNDE